jgi:hypothetical protein
MVHVDTTFYLLEGAQAWNIPPPLCPQFDLNRGSSMSWRAKALLTNSGEQSHCPEKRRSKGSRRDQSAESNRRASATQKVDDQNHDRQHKQDVNESSQCVRTNQSEQPQHQKNHENCPKHKIPPLTVFDLSFFGLGLPTSTTSKTADTVRIE